ncbi:hypothetical protein [Pseudomonas sp.]|uniref:hypothetical protein n=1 Tax=Pseudomonas sp. TaxID=306 RepID=UPI0028B000D9|nr:hypothetical protein [Pseudomonas sp.]
MAAIAKSQSRMPGTPFKRVMHAVAASTCCSVQMLRSTSMNPSGTLIISVLLDRFSVGMGIPRDHHDRMGCQGGVYREKFPGMLRLMNVSPSTPSKVVMQRCAHHIDGASRYEAIY